MKVIHSDEPMILEGKSIFLAGPTPRSRAVRSWRPEALSILESLNFAHTVLVPERKHRSLKFDYMKQVEWEYAGLEGCSLIVFWVPRDIETLPGFTTNVEFGRYVDSGRILYGRPNNAKKIKYLDWLYKKLAKREPEKKLEKLLTTTVELVS
jgi:hypothetical protein